MRPLLPALILAGALGLAATTLPAAPSAEATGVLPQAGSGSLPEPEQPRRRLALHGTGDWFAERVVVRRLDLGAGTSTTGWAQEEQTSTHVDGGTPSRTDAVLDTSRTAAPAEVYRTARYGTFTTTFRLTCSEAEVLAEILRVLGERDLATDMLACHALADEPGDRHHSAAADPRPTLQDVAVALEHLTMASSRHDATAYRAALRDAGLVGDEGRPLGVGLISHHLTGAGEDLCVAFV